MSLPNLQKLYIRRLSTLATTVLGSGFFSLFSLSTAAIAEIPQTIARANSTFDHISVNGGDFRAEYTDYVEDPIRIREAVISLPDGVEGYIDGLFIMDELGRYVYGCMDIPVVDGTDIIQACRWTAYLHPGEVTYHIEGSDFSAGDVEFELSIEFN